ncbi:hypothetical protein GCM10009665_12350 [Kitasatospora nipponensis]|uniref:Peptidase M48 domain-containing protein n=1 Tax=Kitasatospora nipponensis TaxID=258049 RepID=A0ABN1VWJ6_9ACTN
MSETVSALTRACPQCTAPIAVDPRFTDWCPACEWNLAPAPTPGAPRRGERARSRDRARVERLYAVLAARPAASDRHRSAAWAAAMLLATLVHLSTLAVLAGSLRLVLTGSTGLRVLGVLGLGVTWLLRPRFGRWSAHDPAELTREQAPVLHGVVDQVARALGTRGPDRIRVNGLYNASYGPVGPHRRVRLTLGLPLWTALTTDERLALLGHELGHGRNGDARRGLWLDLASRTLVAWYLLLTPGRGDAFLVRSSRTAASDRIAALLLGLLAQPVRLLVFVLARLTERSSQQAEYLADERAAVVASSAAAGGMLTKLMLGDSARARIQQQRTTAQRGGRAGRQETGPEQVEAFWTGLREYLESVPPAERERRSRLSAREMSAVDTEHPPSHLRVRMRAERPERSAAVRVDAAQWLAIEAELAPARQRVGRLLLGR